MANNVSKKKETSVSNINSAMLLQDAGAGQEKMSQEDMMIPRLSILQQMSDQVNKANGGYVPGAEPGMILDNVANKAINGEKGIEVVPISYRRAHIEWKKDRGGLVAVHGSDEKVLEKCSRGDKGEYFTDEGNEIVITGEYFVFLIDDDGYTPAVLSMSKSQFKKARTWNTMMNRLMIDADGQVINPAMFWTSYQLTTVPEKNDQGSWFGWSFKMNHDAKSGGIIQNHSQGEEIYLAARNFKAQVAQGDVKVSPESQDDDVM